MTAVLFTIPLAVDPRSPTIGKGRFQKRREPQGKRLRVNERIRISPIRLIGEDNEQIGVIETSKALEMAKAAALDLVEVAPEASPPVCRIMDYGKWKYQQQKKEQKAKSHSKQSELKEVRLRPSTGDHDLKIKTDKARDFFKEGHKVQFTLLFKGRQMAHRDLGFKMFDRITEEFADIAHVEMTPRVQGRRMTMMMAPGVRAAARPAASGPANTPAPAKPTGDGQASATPQTPPTPRPAVNTTPVEPAKPRAAAPPASGS